MAAPSTPEHEAATTGTAPVTDRETTAPVATTASEGSGKATASLVCGIVGLIAAVFIPLLGWILGGVAIGLGLSARSEIRRRGLSGANTATAGVVLGVVAIVLGIVIVAVVASSIS